jgi:acetyl-CoA carboxylase biotin carboxyl carrier protein
MRETRKKTSGNEPASSRVEFGPLEKLLDFMASHGLEELEYEHEGFRVRLKKAASSNTAPRVGPPAPALSSDLAVPANVAPAAAHVPPAASSAPATEELHVIKSPIVGTFYSAPSPGASAFVKIGDVIQAGQVVCIIEAMKLMNEIEADVSGEIVRGLVENGQPVEYGQGLFAIRPAKKK